jgi:phosphatidylglycerol lysyltransferase
MSHSESRAALRRWLPILIGAALLALALYVLHRELHQLRYRDLVAAVDRLPRQRIVLALLFVCLNYLTLTGYDQLALVYIGRKIARWKVMFTSLVGYAVSNTVGFSIISGTSVRYRFYSRWGLGAADLSRVVLFNGITFWLGLLVLGGVSLTFTPHPALEAVEGGQWARVVGIILLLLVAAYAGASLRHRTALRVWRWEVTIPAPRLVAAQLVLSSAEWALAASVLYALLPPSLPLSFGSFLSVFLAAQLLGLLSHVPGGLGVFEGVVVLLLGPYLPPEQVLSSLVLYRVVYYVLPLSAALLLLVADEVRQRRAMLARAGSIFGALSVQLAPRVLAVFIFFAGALLLLSGATPAESERIRALAKIFPLAVFEASHFIGSLVGVGLLLVSSGVARRLDLAYYLAVVGLIAGIAASVLKGGDYEEAVLLSLLLVVFIPSHPEFDRKAAFFATRFSAGWVLAVLAVLGASVWLGFFAYRHVEYSERLWWQVTLQADASRFLRATLGATVGLLVFGIVRLLRPAPPEVPKPTDEELAEAAKIIARQNDTIPFLVFLRDKGLLFSEARDAFLMYAVQGKSWIALGDPVGPAAAGPELIRAFLERADDYGGQPVFYQVGKERLHQYADFGLTFVKLGEEARVSLKEFSLEGGENKPFRLVMNRFEKSGASIRLVPPEEVPALIPALREISDLWLKQKSVAEKGFSLGRFKPDYLERFPVAVVEMEGRIVAFANVWPGPTGVELSVDLIRFSDDAPKNTMEALFLHLMLWGKEEGYEWFSLGMAPLSGLESSGVAATWSKVAHLVYRYGEQFYNFQGLRTYKEKFHPVWTPRYLAYPGGLALPRILADVTALIAGGYRHIFR